jgi:haloalkane dehalogenase
LHEIERRLSGLAHRPWLLIWGMRDWCFSPHFLERFLTFVPGAEVLRLEHAGHWVVEDAPEEIAQRVEQFLESHPLSLAAT